jgi:hypothetical protein
MSQRNAKEPHMSAAASTQPTVSDKVTVRIGRFTNPDGSANLNIAYVPGRVVDAIVADRVLTTQRGPITVRSSVVVISLRANLTPSNGRPPFYFTQRAEALVSLSLRTEDVPAIDGDKTPWPVLLNLLNAAVAASTAALNPPPAKTVVAEAFSVFASAPALTA